jgi:hypothetical protein
MRRLTQGVNTMFERTFTPVLVFMMLAGGTFAIGHELFAPEQVAMPARQVAVVSLPTVEVTGHRPAAIVRIAKADAAHHRFQ